MPKAVCPHCQAVFRVKDEVVGKKVRCAKCKQPFRVGGEVAAASASKSKPKPARAAASRGAQGPPYAQYRDAYAEAIFEVRHRMGRPPRDFSADLMAADAVRRGDTRNVDDALGHAMIDMDPFLLAHGEVVWAAVVQANDRVYQPNFADPSETDAQQRVKPEALPGNSIVATDPRVGHMLQPLLGIAASLFAVKQQEAGDPVAKWFGELYASETSALHGLRVPIHMTGGVPVSSVGVVYDARHLPGAQLTAPFYPVLVHPATPGVMIVPSHFWGQRMHQVMSAQPAALSEDVWQVWATAAIADPQISPQTGQPASPPQGAVAQTFACQALYEVAIINEVEELLTKGYVPDDPSALIADALRAMAIGADMTIKAGIKRGDMLLERVEQIQNHPAATATVEVAQTVKKLDASVNRKVFALFGCIGFVVLALFGGCIGGIIMMMM